MFLDLFVNDFKTNYTYILTFCDREKTVIIDLLDNKEFMLVEIIPYIENPWFYKFNNSIIFEKDLDNEFNESFFKLGIKNFWGFYKENYQKISLNISKKNYNIL